LHFQGNETKENALGEMNFGQMTFYILPRTNFGRNGMEERDKFLAKWALGETLFGRNTLWAK